MWHPPLVDWIAQEAPIALDRILERVAPEFRGHDRRRRRFEERLTPEFERLFRMMYRLYGWQYDFSHHLEQVVLTAARAAADRPGWLRRRDRTRSPGTWMYDPATTWLMAYTERLAGDLGGVSERMPHLARLGVTHLHLMPLYAVPEGPDDGGYAVSDYRRVRPDLGTTADLRRLARRLDEHGIGLVLDFVANHTADDHPWAEAVKAGDPRFRRFYFVFDDREEPDRYAPHLREIFPDRGGDAFTWRSDVPGPGGGAWIWTTFYPFQWDLDYRNPEVLAAALGEVLHIANVGASVVRMDATPFLWKEEGTPCENLPEAHVVLQIIALLVEAAAPSTALLSEAIVHPDDVAAFVRPEECPLGYNPLVMATCWEALATRDTTLLRYSIRHRMALPEGTQWLTYLRCHDDIGWGFADEDAREVGIDPDGHRAFLNDFYDGTFPDSFSAGLRFQENPRTGDARMSGTLAALAGLEKALVDDDEEAVDLAVRRILALHTVILTVGGIPMLYAGDEIAQLNDHGYAADPRHHHDNRWAHRPFFDDDRLLRAVDGAGPEGQVLHGLHRLLELRRRHPATVDVHPVVIDLAAREVVAYVKEFGDDRLFVAVNLSERPVAIEAGELPQGAWIDADTREPVYGALDLAAYGAVILVETGQNSVG